MQYFALVYLCLLYGLVCKLARWIKSSVVIGYTQAVKMELSWTLKTPCCVPQEKFPQKPYTL